MRVSIIGTGYVGLVTGVCLAEVGQHVTCVDIDAAKVDSINRGVSPIYEAGLDELLRRNLGARFNATADLVQAVLDTDLSMIAVGTPFKGSEIDLSYVKAAAQQIGAALANKGYHTVIVKSTVVPGTTDTVVTPILESASGKRAIQDFGVGMNPEFLREGEALSDFMNPDRIVLGGSDDRTRDVLDCLYSAFPKTDKIRTSNKTAETIKYTSNSLLATMISFSNEIANLCSSMGDVDVVEVLQGVHLDRRLTPILADGSRVIPGFTTYLAAGCGFGGSCFPKDVRALVAHGAKVGNRMRLLEAVMEINEDQPKQVIRLLKKHFPDLNAVRVGVLGLAFKPGTDDMRESPAIPIVRALQSEGASVTAFDPIARQEAAKFLNPEKLKLTDSLKDAVSNTDAVIIVTRWPEFESLPTILQEVGSDPLVIDGRRMLQKARVSRYEGVGA